MSVLAIPSNKLYKIINISSDELNEYEIYTGVGGNRLKLDSDGRCNTWFESNNPLYEDYLFQIPYGRPLNKEDDWTIRIKTKQKALDTIPSHKLYNIINVSSGELNEYEIYTGVGGNRLKLDSDGRCYKWFESNNPLYEDYLFQIPYGRPRTQSDNWQILIKKKTGLDQPIPLHKLHNIIAVNLDELKDYAIYIGIGGRDFKLVNGRCDTWFESSNPRYKDYLFQIIDDLHIRIKTKQKIFDTIPWDKLYSLITVSLDELTRYEIYTGGINGTKLKLDSNGRCYTWFESNNPLYEDYLFQIPFGRPLNQLGNWQIIIKKKSILDDPIPIQKLNTLFAVDKYELSDYKINIGIGGTDLKLDSNGRCDTWFESNNPRYKDYLFQIPRGIPEATGIYIKIKKVKFSYLPDNLDDIKLLHWVTENVNNPLIVRQNVVDQLKIYTGTNQSDLPILKEFSFNLMQHPEFTRHYSLIISFNNPKEGGSSRKRKNRIIRKSRKNRKSLHN